MQNPELAAESTRPKLRTRRAISYHEVEPKALDESESEGEESDKQQQVLEVDEDDVQFEFDDGTSDTNDVASTPPNQRQRQRTQHQPTQKRKQKTSDDDDDDDGDDDFEMPAEDEQEDDDDDDEEDAMTESSDDKALSRRPRRAAAQQTLRGRKRKAATSKSKTSGRRRRRVVLSTTEEEDEDDEDNEDEDDDDESPTSSSSNEQETEEDTGSSPSASGGERKAKKSKKKKSSRQRRNGHRQSLHEESEDEILFRVDKILAREVHSLLEWNKRCAKMTTRFVQSGSIFLEEEEDEQADIGKKQQSQSVDLTSSPASDKKDSSVAADAGDQEKVVNMPSGGDNIDLTCSPDTSQPKVVDKPSEPSKPSEAAATEDKEVTKPPVQKDLTRKEERFLIKWQKLSYIHVSWETEKALREYDKNTRPRIQRFREKELYGLLNNELYGDEYFNPEFCNVDRILTIQDKPGDQFSLAEEEESQESKKYKFFLVKWKALAYDAITWERDDDVSDDAAVKQFYERIEHTIHRQKQLKPAKASLSKFRPYSSTNPPVTRADQDLELRDYQLTGVNWMLFNWYQGRNSLLADEMGLGKTVQTVTFLNHLATVERVSGPFLIVAPLSTLTHWQREFQSWTNLNAVVYHGSMDARKCIEQYEFYLTNQEIENSGIADAHRIVPGSQAFKSKAKTKAKTKTQAKADGEERVRDFYRFDVLITSYEMCSCQSFSTIARIKYSMLVVDEAHRLKNRSSKLSTFLHTHFSFRNCLLLTGTPLQNNVEELWTLLNFLDGQKFKKFDEFEAEFGELKDAEQVEKLQVELKPFLLRRMKEDVEKTLAPKEETIIEVELTVLQKQYYRAIYEQNTEFLMRGTKKSNAPSLLNIVMELRKCCNHPFLINSVEDREVKRLQESNVSSTTNKALSPAESQQQINDLLVNSSGKLILLDKLLPRLKENGHRVLIFSQFKIMLNILQDYLRLRAYQCERIDGNVTGNDRQAAVDRFCDPNSSAFVMLLSTRAGGVGINLTAADTVIIYDSDWNPQNDLQAQSRCHRIGQKKSVKIYRLLTSKTYEMQMFHMASMKLGLDQAVLGNIRQDSLQSQRKKNTSSGPPALTKQEIDNLLKHGAYEVFKEEKEGDAEAASKRFGEESIDQILSRSTKIIHDPKAQVDDDGKSKSLMSSFSKATFVSSSNPDEEVDINDPDFWSKVIGLKAVEEDKSANSLEFSPLQTRRCRRKAKSYKEDGSDNESPKRKRQRLHNGLVDDEYIVSVSEESDSEEDLGDFSLESENESGKKRSRTKSNNLPIRYHGERIVECLQSFGYGRWAEIMNCERCLAPYGSNAIRQYSQEFIMACVRLGASARIAARLARAAKLQKVNDNSPSPVKDDKFVDYRTVLSPETIETTKKAAMDEFGQRFELVRDLLRELNLERVTLFRGKEVQLPLRNDRDAMVKLQQIDRMYLLDRVVKVKLMPVPAISWVVERMQFLEDEKLITVMIDKGEIPPDLPPVTDCATTIAHEKQAATTLPTESSHVSDGPVETSVEQQKQQPGQPAVESGCDDKKQNKQFTAGQPAEEKKMDSRTAEDNAEAKDKAEDTPTDSEVQKSEDTPCDQPKAKVQQAIATKEQEAKLEASSVDKPTLQNSMEPVAPVFVASPAPAIDVSKPGGTPQTSTATSTSNLTLANPNKKELKEPVVTPSKEHLKAAMRVLKRLPSTSCTIVAPWWIPIIDDVALVLYVHREGWLRGRKLTQKLIDSPLFGKRAFKHNIQTWPTLAVLHGRLRAVVTGWGDWKKMSQYEHMINAMEELPKVQTPVAMPRSAVPTGPASVSQIPALQRSMTPPAMRIEERRPDFDDTSRALAPSAASNTSGSSTTDDTKRRHIRFARLLFSFGIPDTRTCQSPDEVLEKWRYFLHDPILHIKSVPVKLLLDEAMDLEDACRKRLRQTANSTAARMVSAKRSVLGGNRGSWYLTDAQCRRLINRVELFRALRSHVLVLAPRRLVEVMTRVRQVLSPDSIRNKPTWWSSPRHDILLLQGVECYGLDDYLADVWKLPLFAMSNPSKMFPNTAWVENIVSMLVVKAHQVLRTSAKAARDAPEDLARKEASQRVQDIRGMRQEDPLFNVNVHAWRVDLRRADRDKTARRTPERNQKQTSPTLHVNGASLLVSPSPNKNHTPAAFVAAATDGSPDKAQAAVSETWKMKGEDPHFSKEHPNRPQQESELQQPTTNADDARDKPQAEEEDQTEEQRRKLLAIEHQRRQREAEDQMRHEQQEREKRRQKLLEEQKRKQQVADQRRKDSSSCSPVAAAATKKSPGASPVVAAPLASARLAREVVKRGTKVQQPKQEQTNDENTPQVRSNASSKLRQTILNVTSLKAAAPAPALAALALTAAAPTISTTTKLSTKRKRMAIPAHDVIVIEDSSEEDEESARRTRSRRRFGN